MRKTIAYRKGELYDRNLSKLNGLIKHKCKEKNDDFFLAIFGDTGSGKSHLGLWFYEDYAGAQANVSFIGFNKIGFAKALNFAKEAKNKDKKDIVVFYDEANVYSTEVMARYNKSLMRVMAEIREMNFFHIWCMPNPGKLQQDFIDERIDGIIYIPKGKKKESVSMPRVYYFFSRKVIDKLVDPTGEGKNKRKLTLPYLRKNKGKATFKGCFKEYSGFLLEDYKKKKAEKMEDSINDFFDQFGGESHSLYDVAEILNCSYKTIYRHVQNYRKENKITEGKDYKMTGYINKKIQFTNEGLENLRKLAYKPT